MGFDALATGHHVRLEHTDAGYKMYRPADRAKDQTYVLYMASQEQLAHTLWPVGEYLKSDLRKMAAERGLLTANKPDSHDICFIPAGNLDAFLRPRIGARPGAVIDSDGTHLADHDGAWRFTIGQRKGLGIAGLGEPRFVTAIEGDTITVGRRCDTEIDMVTADDTHWISGRMPSRAEIARLTVQVRYRASALVTDVTIGRNRQIVLKFPKMKPEGVAPGQAVVLYDGDECVGGATVNCTE
jgi:tRNA-specific 2-thiouridylase